MHKNNIKQNQLPYYSQYPFDEKNISNLVEENLSEIESISSNASNNSDVTIKSEKINNLKDDDQDNEIKTEHNENWYTTENNYKSYQNMINIMKDKRKLDLENLAKKKYVQNILLPFDNDKSNTVPSTSIYCGVLSSIDTAPCAIPCEEKNSKFKVFGVFCSPECAAAYIFDNYQNDDLWEKYSLLNYMYSKLYNEDNFKIKPAAPRQCLKIFGGTLNIKHFREYNTNFKKNFKVIVPPLISIIPQQEYSFLNKNYSTKTDTISENKIPENNSEDLF